MIWVKCVESDEWINLDTTQLIEIYNYSTSCYDVRVFCSGLSNSRHDCYKTIAEFKSRKKAKEFIDKLISIKMPSDISLAAKTL